MMLIFKLSWVPYILIIAGIAVAADGDASALILTAIGIIWLIIKYYNKSKNSSNSNTQNETSFSTNSAPATNQSANVKYCRNCGAKLEDGDVFCVECGSKI